MTQFQNKVKRLARRVSHFLYFRNLAFDRHVAFLGKGKIYFDPHYKRGCWFQKTAGLTQAGVTGLWYSAIRLLRPDLALDIGANYGEIALSSKYARPCKIVLFEGNPNIVGLLRKSIAAHKNRSDIHLEECLVSDTNGWLTFHINAKNSGGSSARDVSGDDLQDIEVPSVSLDSYFGDNPGFRRILFKIDVEGYEGYVLRGMNRLLRSAESFIGIAEFSRSHLDATGYGSANFFRDISTFGAVAYLDRNNKLHPVAEAELLPDHTDIVLCSPPDLMDRLSVSKWIRAR